MKKIIKNKKNFKFGLGVIIFSIVGSLITGIGELLMIGLLVGIIAITTEEDLD